MKETAFKLPPLFTLADLLLLLSVGGASFAFYGFRLWNGGQHPQSMQAVVRSGDREVARLNLAVDTTLVVEGVLGGVRIVLRSGGVHFENAPCALKICEKTGEINRSGEMIVCAPSRIIARIEGGPAPAAGLDALSR